MYGHISWKWCPSVENHRSLLCIQRIIKTGFSKALNGLIQVVHSLQYSRPFKLMDQFLNSRPLGSV